jgi:hypothetical protein
MAAAMRAQWDKVARSIVGDLHPLLRAGKFAEAQGIVARMSLVGIVSNVRPKIEELATAALLFGAHHQTGDLLTTVYAKGKALPQELHNAIDQLVHAVEVKGRDYLARKLHDFITAQSERHTRLQKFNGNHDERGRFASASATAAPKAKSYTPFTDKMTNEEIVAGLTRAQTLADAIPETYLLATEDRVGLRKSIADDLYNKDIGIRVQGHEATIILGLPGAGKSTFSEPLRLAGTLEIDNDLAKEKLPEFSGGLGARAVHEEAGAITDDVLARATANGDNIVWPRIDSPEKVLQDTQKLVSQGYTVHVILIDVSHATSATSVIERYFATGRYIPPNVVAAYGDKPRAAFDGLAKSGMTASSEVWKRGNRGDFVKTEG